MEFFIAMSTITLFCWASIVILTFGRKYLLNLIPLFKDNEFHEKTYGGNRMSALYSILQFRRTVTYDTKYKDIIIMALITMIPILNALALVVIFVCFVVLLITDICLLLVEYLKKVDFWDKNI